MGYTMMPNEHHRRRFKAAFRKFKSQERYVEQLQSIADTKRLGKEKFPLPLSTRMPSSYS